MKRTFTANINGRIFNIDEDAFNLLNNYLEQLRIVFRGNEGDEIVADIEGRISEIFAARTDSGQHVITINDVSTMIETMGSPYDLGGDDSTPGAVPPPLPENETQPPFISVNMPGHKKLYRNLQNKVFGGVFGGLALYLGWNANIMRLLYVVLTLFTHFWPLTLIYLLAWMIIPAAVTPQQRLDMNGDPRTVQSVGEAVIATETPVTSDGGFIRGFFSVLGKLLMGILGLATGAISFCCLLGILILGAGAIAYGIAGSATILSGLDLYPMAHMWSAIAGAFSGFGVGMLLFGLISWGALSVVFNFKGLGKASVITILIIAMLLFAFAAILLALALG